MSARNPCEYLISDVVEAGLCTRCGTCVGICPVENIKIPDPLGTCLPEAGDVCISCGLCLEGCPGARVDFESLERMVFGTLGSNRLTGFVRKAFLAYASDEGTRRKGASGGTVTALLMNLLERREVNGVLLYAQDKIDRWKGAGRVIEDEEEIKRASQSRYHLSPMNTALRDLKGEEGRYAYVGLPCHVHALRKLEITGWKAGVDLSPIIGIYCGNNLYFEATAAMLRKLGIQSLESIEELSYREGRWPGNFYVRTRDGRESRVTKLEFNQTIPFFINRRCLFCTDLTNELADISVGDGWAKEGIGSEGWSIVLTRTPKGEQIIDAAVESGAIHIEEISIDEAVRMHSHALDLKKSGAFIRLGMWKCFGVRVPAYMTEYPSISAGRRIVELLVSLQFAFCSSKAGKAIFGLLPLKVLGGLFRWLRKTWMHLTGG